jgi:hypothetical protein
VGGREATRRMARYADDIFRGANPGDLPIKAALSHEVVVNLQTARRLGGSAHRRRSLQCGLGSSRLSAYGELLWRSAARLLGLRRKTGLR